MHSNEKIVDVVEGSLWGSHPPKRSIAMAKDKSLNEEIEVEEIYNNSEEQAKVIQEEYNNRKHSYASKIMKELEAFVECPAEEWELYKEEDKLIDILSLVDNIIKSQLGDNKLKHKE